LQSTLIKNKTLLFKSFKGDLMNYRVLHLSIALLTLAPSLHGAEKKPQKKRTFAQVAQATQQPGLAGILPLSGAVKKQ
jgi:hypothetical protein